MTDNSTEPGAVAGRDSVHFGYYASSGQAPSLLLYKKGSDTVEEEIPFPGNPAPGNFYSMRVRLPAGEYEYNFLDCGRVVTDPYARRISGRRVYGEVPPESAHSLRGGFVYGSYHWGEDGLPDLPYEDAVMYHLHVRGFTMHRNSGVRQKGTFAGLMRKIPYLKSLGINQVKLMPVYEFPEMVAPPLAIGSPQAGEKEREREIPAKQYRLNYWGYGPGFYFAPKASYAAAERPDIELKDMVKAFHASGIEVILEFFFTEQADVAMICRCLNYWAEEYHIDGFSILGREDLYAELAGLPLFRSRKLLCAWYPEAVTNREQGGERKKIAQSNDAFMNDCRRLLKGDSGFLEAFAYHERRNPTGCAQINYMTNHDGFTLLDLVSYNQKHNEANQEGGLDGSECNFSWNCGEEGPTGKRAVLHLRMKQRKNAYAMLLFAQGTPMLLAGDEFGNSQQGNNNPYCHDSELTWLTWSRRKEDRELTEFVRRAIQYRRDHRVLHQKSELLCTDQLSIGFPDLSYHGERAWYIDLGEDHLHMGCMYSGHYAGEAGFLYLAWNFHWEEQQFALPLLPKTQSWYKVMDTSLEESFLDEKDQPCLGNERLFSVTPRTVVILEGREDKNAGKETAHHSKKNSRPSENHHGTQASGHEALLPDRALPSGTDA